MPRVRIPIPIGVRRGEELTCPFLVFRSNMKRNFSIFSKEKIVIITLTLLLAGNISLELEKQGADIKFKLTKAQVSPVELVQRLLDLAR